MPENTVPTKVKKLKNCKIMASKDNDPCVIAMPLLYLQNLLFIRGFNKKIKKIKKLKTVKKGSQKKIILVILQCHFYKETF